MGDGVRSQNGDDIVSGVLNFIGHEANVGFPPSWKPAHESKLWQYNLHYFEYLWSLEPGEAIDVALDWIEKHPYGRDQVGWEPYPLSLRIQNWCGYFLARHHAVTESDSSFHSRIVESIAQQAAVLEKNLEFHLLGNHLLENAASLVLAGACLSGTSADRQFVTGLKILQDQLPEQVLPDGGHFERSPMYQSRITYLLSQMAALDNDRVNFLLGDTLAKMKRVLALTSHPDGEIALFNDAAFGIAPIPSDLGVAAPIFGSFSLPDSGYYGARTEQGDFVICDAGPVGPDYIPGHAHGDIFSFELSLAGSRTIVDSGVFGYEADEMRSYCRSTRAHNTVEIGGADQCEFWGAFRVARRGRPDDVTFHQADDGFRLSGEHDGYRRLAGGPTHRRSFRWFDRGILVVDDEISSSVPVDYVSRLHLHPHCAVVALNNQTANVKYPGGDFVVAWRGKGELGIEDSWYCPNFGVRAKNTALAFSASAPGKSGFCIAPDESRITFSV
jgi:uncharacterized heparinase superfamily protein